MPAQGRHCIPLGIVGQCLADSHSHSLADHLSPEIIAGEVKIERTAHLIIEFSQTGLRGMRPMQQAAPLRRRLVHDGRPFRT